MHRQFVRIATASLVALVWTAWGAAVSPAQDRTESIMSGIIAECVSATTVTADPIRIAIPDIVAFAQPDLVRSFRASGRTVLLSNDRDSVETVRPAIAPSTLFISVDEAQVTYDRHSRRQINRTVSLRLRYVVTDSGDRISASDRCEASATDVIDRSSISRVENDLYPVTKGDIPGPTGLRRVLGPVVAGAAAVVSAYLLFSLRSESNTGS